MWTLAWDVHAFTHQPLDIFDANIYHPLRRTLGDSECVRDRQCVNAYRITLTPTA
jgi:hypothetical protein